MFRTDMIMLRFPGMMAVVLAGSLAAAGDSALPGHHPLTQAQAGSVLLAELRCAACHEGTAPGSVPEKSAPDLKEVGQRVSADYLRQFLTSPQKAHPGTTMPDMLAGDSEADRSQIAEALTHFLVAARLIDNSGSRCFIRSAVWHVTVRRKLATHPRRPIRSKRRKTMSWTQLRSPERWSSRMPSHSGTSGRSTM
jgi:cytochrome c2